MYYNHETEGLVNIVEGDQDNVVVVEYYDAKFLCTYAEEMSARFIDSCIANGVLTLRMDQDYVQQHVVEAATLASEQRYWGWVVMARKHGDLCRRLRINQDAFLLAGPFWADTMGLEAANEKAANIVSGSDAFWYKHELRKWKVRVDRRAWGQ
jgi:hypothetical protein